MLFRAACATFALASGSLYAQSNPFERPPAEVDQALRARVSKFYQAHVDGKFRLADEVVHEDSKEQFFASPKKRIYGFEIRVIVYEENYTRAKVSTLMDMDWQMMQDRVRVKAPILTLWKLDKGEWWMYLLKRDENAETPFGRISRAVAEEAASTPAKTPYQVAEEQNRAALAKLVTVDRETIELSRRTKWSGEVVVSNRMPTSAEIAVSDPQVLGLLVKAEGTVIEPNSAVRVRFEFFPKKAAAPADPVEVKIMVPQLETVIPVKVAVKKS
ncbi:MAG: hypothetical protein SFV54_21735 [Bryobacteraceae bacterium]|nr:hypothetical protein [Bryobacteraceae bacterium]